MRFSTAASTGIRRWALAQKRDLLTALVTQQAKDYFMDGSPLAKLFDRTKKNCVPKKYSSDNAWNKVWTQEFVARHLALFIALHFKREQERTNAPTRSSRNKRQKGSKTMNNLKRAFKKLLGSYTDAKVLYDNEKMAKLNRTHRTPSLDKQQSGPRRQDALSWNPALHDNGFNCPDCFHGYTMCIEINSEVNAHNANARQHQDAAAAAAAALKSKSKSKHGDGAGTDTDADGEQATRAAKHGCYCQTFNCFGKFDGIGCPECVKKAAEGVPTVTTDAGKCPWNCKVCTCRCISIWDEDKRQTIATSNHKNRSNEFNQRALATPADGEAKFVDVLGGYLQSRGKCNRQVLMTRMRR